MCHDSDPTPMRLRLLLIPFRFAQNENHFFRPEPELVMGKVGKNPELAPIILEPTPEDRFAQHYPESFGIARSCPESLGIGFIRNFPESFGVVRIRLELETFGIGRSRPSKQWPVCEVPAQSKSKKTQLNVMPGHKHIVGPVQPSGLLLTPTDSDSDSLRSTLDDSELL